MHFDYAQCKQKGFVPILIVIILAALAGGYFVYTNYSNNQPKSVSNQASVGETIKIGGYKILIKDGWEELEYLGTKEAKNTNEIVTIFGQLYPQYTDKNAEMYIREIIVSSDTAQLYFGGDEGLLTNRMGTTGSLHYSGLVTFALTENPRIKKVDFKLKQEGEHFGPGIRIREDFIELWPTELLEKAVTQGNQKAQEILSIRKGTNLKTYTSKVGRYSIKYPQDYMLYEDKMISVDGVTKSVPDYTSIVSPVIPLVKSNFVITIAFDQLKILDKTPQGVMEYVESCSAIKSAKGAQYNLDGQSALIFEDAPCGPYGTTKIYAVSKDKYTFNVIEIQSHAIFKDIKQEVDKILSTFRFTQ